VRTAALAAGICLGVFGCGGKTVASGDSNAEQGPGATDNGVSFRCGSSDCDDLYQVCEHVLGGSFVTDQSTCIPIPAECASSVTCSCVQSVLQDRGAVECSAAGSAITVEIDVP
jgi:hypothetical protein